MRPAFLALVWSAVSVGVFSLSACYGHTCEGSTIKFGRELGEGHLLTENSWESNAFNVPWLEFPHQRIIDIDLHELGTDRVPDVMTAYISAQDDPLKEGGNFTVGAGNLATFTADRGHITVHNDTCADYYVRVYVEAAAIAPIAPISDAGTD